MNTCPYTDEKCNSCNCTHCTVYLEMEYGCDGNCDNCNDADICDHLGKMD